VGCTDPEQMDMETEGQVYLENGYVCWCSFIIPRCRTKCGGLAFSIAGPEVWNHLPQFMQSAASVIISNEHERLTTLSYTSIDSSCHQF